MPRKRGPGSGARDFNRKLMVRLDEEMWERMKWVSYASGLNNQQVGALALEAYLQEQEAKYGRAGAVPRPALDGVRESSPPPPRPKVVLLSAVEDE